MTERIYLKHPATEETVAVATGFSWGAFLLGFVWALSKRMWFVALMMVVINVLLFFSGLLGDAGDLIGFVLSVAFGIVCGQYGNRWHQRSLEQRGYVVL
jgi:hypothetical protein